MRWRYILNIVGILNLFFGLTMVFPLLCGLFYKDSSVIPLLKSMGLTVGGGALRAGAMQIGTATTGTPTPMAS